jgi:hypothetical protein
MDRRVTDSPFRTTVADHMVGIEDGFSLRIRVPRRQCEANYLVTCTLRRDHQISDAEIDLFDAVLSGLMTQRDLRPSPDNDNTTCVVVPSQR